MNTVPQAGNAATPGPSALRTGLASHGGQKKPVAAQGGAELFSSLLSLASAAHEPSSPAAAAPDSTGAAPAGGQTSGAAADDNPLVALLAARKDPSAAGAAAAATPSARTESGSATALTAVSAEPAAAPGQALQLPTTASGQPLQQLVAAPGQPLQPPTTASRPGPPGPPAGSDSVGNRSAAAALQWRKAAATTAAEFPGLAGAASAATPVLRARAEVLPIATRSTVALHDRFGLSFTPEMPADDDRVRSGGSLGTLLPVNLGAALGKDGDTNPTGALPIDAALPELRSEVSDIRAAADTAQTSLGTQAEAETTEVSHWSTQNLRHASLRVGPDGAEAIDIRLTLCGQELQVDFRTDNSDARASLQQHAAQSLGELLQRGGIQLGDVSVGAQGQPSGREAATDQATGTKRLRGAAAPEPLPASPLPARADGSRALDLFV